MSKGVKISGTLTAVWFATTLAVYYGLGSFLPDGIGRRVLAAVIVGLPFALWLKLSSKES